MTCINRKIFILDIEPINKLEINTSLCHVSLEESKLPENQLKYDIVYTPIIRNEDCEKFISINAELLKNTCNTLLIYADIGDDEKNYNLLLFVLNSLSNTTLKKTLYTLTSVMKFEISELDNTFDVRVTNFKPGKFINQGGYDKVIENTSHFTARKQRIKISNTYYSNDDFKNIRTQFPSESPSNPFSRMEGGRNFAINTFGIPTFGIPTTFGTTVGIPQPSVFGTGTTFGTPQPTVFGTTVGIPQSTVFGTGTTFGIPQPSVFGTGTTFGIPQPSVFGTTVGIPQPTVFGTTFGIPQPSVFGTGTTFGITGATGTDYGIKTDKPIAKIGTAISEEDQQLYKSAEKILEQQELKITVREKSFILYHIKIDILINNITEENLNVAIAYYRDKYKLISSMESILGEYKPSFIEDNIYKKIIDNEINSLEDI